MSQSNCPNAMIISFSLPGFNMIARSFLYGIYVNLFGICIYILRQRKNRPRTLFVVTTTALFLLSTAQAAIYTMLDLQDIMDLSQNFLSCSSIGQNSQCDLDQPQWNISLELALMYVAASTIADGLLIYCCYIVWGSRKRIIAVPVVLLLGSIGCGIASALLQGFMGDYFLLGGLETPPQFYPSVPDPRIHFIMSLVTNVVVTTLTAGRIWWISRQASSILGRSVTKRYSTTIAIILESGFIYTVVVAIYLIVTLVNNHGLGTSVPYASLTQIVGIVPTLMIVRVGLGASVDSVEASVTAARSDHRLRLGLEHVETDVLRTPVEMSIIDIRRQRRNTAVPLNGSLGSVGGVSVEEVSK